MPVENDSEEIPVDDGHENDPEENHDPITAVFAEASNTEDDALGEACRRLIAKDHVQLSYVIQSAVDDKLCMNPQSNGRPDEGSIVQWYTRCDKNDKYLRVQEVPTGDGKTFYLMSPSNGFRCIKPTEGDDWRLRWSAHGCCDGAKGGTTWYKKYDGHGNFKLLLSGAHHNGNVCAIPRRMKNEDDFHLRWGSDCQGTRSMMKELKDSRQRLKPRAKECKVTKAPKGYWKWRKYSNAANWELEFTESVETSDTNERSKTWEKEVENAIETSLTVSTEGPFGGAEASVSHGYRELVKNGVTNTLSKTTTNTKGVVSKDSFTKPGSAWQFVVDVVDACGSSKLQTETIVRVNGGASEPPCCAPNGEKYPGYLHGPCKVRSDCTCSKAVCDGDPRPAKHCPAFCKNSKTDIFVICTSSYCRDCAFCQ
jgi:hypothetical protein